MKDIQKVVEMLKLHQPTPKNMDEARQKHYQFWDTQPVPKLGMCNCTFEEKKRQNATEYAIGRQEIVSREISF